MKNNTGQETNYLPVLREFRLTYLVPALVATTREAIKVIIRGALIRGGGAGEDSADDVIRKVGSPSAKIFITHILILPFHATSVSSLQVNSA